MSLKDISYLELWQPLRSVEWNHLCNFDRMHHNEQFCEIILNLDQWFRKRFRFKIFLIWSSGDPYFSGAEPFLQSGRRHHEEQFCEIILNKDQWFRRCRLKIFLIWSSGGSLSVE